jgi:hypothetical protein
VTSESFIGDLEENDDDADMTPIIVGVIAAVLVVCGLTALVVVLAKRRKSNSNKKAEEGYNAVSLDPANNVNNNKDHYQRLSSPSLTGVEVATSDEKLAPTKSWEINYSELKMLETVGEGAFGTVHRAIFRHQEVAVKQLKSQIDQKEVRRYEN